MGFISITLLKISVICKTYKIVIHKFKKCYPSQLILKLFGMKILITFYKTPIANNEYSDSLNFYKRYYKLLTYITI